MKRCDSSRPGNPLDCATVLRSRKPSPGAIPPPTRRTVLLYVQHHTAQSASLVPCNRGDALRYASSCSLPLTCSLQTALGDMPNAVPPLSKA